MSRAPIYATNASLEEATASPPVVADGKPSVSGAVIRHPIRQAYDSQDAYDTAVLQGMVFAKEHDIPYINHY